MKSLQCNGQNEKRCTFGLLLLNDAFVGVSRRGAGENGQTQSLLTGTEKIGMCPSFFPIFDMSPIFDRGDSLGFLDISVRRENFGQSESSLVHDSEVLEASQVASNTL